MAVFWKSPSTGKQLEFGAFNPNTSWRDLPGIYAFAKADHQGNWQIIYVGQTTSFRDRFSSHEHWMSAMGLGCTHILAAVMHEANERNIFERELIAELRPQLNSQLKP